MLGAAGYLGHLCVGLVDTQQLASLLGMLIVVGLAQVGVNPIVTVTLLVGLLPTLGIACFNWCIVNGGLGAGANVLANDGLHAHLMRRVQGAAGYY